MRHASIETTLKYYVKENADSLAARLWEASNISFLTAADG